MRVGRGDQARWPGRGALSERVISTTGSPSLRGNTHSLPLGRQGWRGHRGCKTEKLDAKQHRLPAPGRIPALAARPQRFLHHPPSSPHTPCTPQSPSEPSGPSGSLPLPEAEWGAAAAADTWSPTFRRSRGACARRAEPRPAIYRAEPGSRGCEPGGCGRRGARAAAARGCEAPATPSGSRSRRAPRSLPARPAARAPEKLSPARPPLPRLTRPLAPSLLSPLPPPSRPPASPAARS